MREREKLFHISTDQHVSKRTDEIVKVKFDMNKGLFIKALIFYNDNPNCSRVM